MQFNSPICKKKKKKTQIAIEIELDEHKHEANCSLQSGYHLAIVAANTKVALIVSSISFVLVGLLFLLLILP
jgi:hypothetical protein